MTAKLKITTTLLEDWVKNVITTPIEVLNDKYPDDDIAMAELDSLFLPLIESPSLKHKVKESSFVSHAVLRQLHRKLQSQPCEDALWGGVFYYLVNPLPVAMAHDLVDRWIAPIMMGMTRQVDEVQWRLATFNEEALYTLVRERYQDSKYSIAQFDTMLRQYAFTIYGDGILYMLSFYETESPEKKAALIAAIIREKRNWRKYKEMKKRLKQFLREQSQ